MARILLADDGISFDGRMRAHRPLGGAETALTDLAEAFAALGHDVSVHNRCDAALTWNGVRWLPLTSAPDRGIGRQADLYIPNRSARLLTACPEARRTLFWLHNPAGYLRKLRNQWPLFRRRPVLVFSGESHRNTYPRWCADGGREIIPLGISPEFLLARERKTAPPPRALFCSNPMRSLDWLLDVWAQAIAPALPGAELHIFAGAAVYGSAGDAKARQMSAILDKAAALRDQGVLLRGPVSKNELAAEMAAARLLLYRGDKGETFCLAAAESQAMGLPAVLEDIACMRERVIDGKTGFVVRGADAFAAAAVRLLTDDALWQRQHHEALTCQRHWTWQKAAEAFLTLAGLQ